ncbi:hypothetical protein LNO81_16040 [Klebsiella variicola subsp. variicola]|nr:hypothetical protein [Klebsiella variicola subsp. variicola]
MVGELNGIQGPDIGAQTAHRKLGGTVAGVAKHNVRLNGEDVLHFLTTTLKKKGVVSHALVLFFYFQQTRQ